MNIQDSINEAKKEFTSDEQMLASAFKLEKFYKKHKIKIFAALAVAVLFFGGRAVMEMVEMRKLNAANEAYLALQQDSANQEARATLQEKNPALFELFSYKQAMENNDTEALKSLASSNNMIIADIAAYHLSVMEGREGKSELYKEVAFINNAYLFIKEGKVMDAKNELAQIDTHSPVYSFAQYLNHYTIKGH